MTQPPLDSDLEFMKHLGKYLGVLAVRILRLDKNGKDIGKPIMQTYSGFFIKLDNQWYFVTAGHVFERHDNNMIGLKQALDATAIRIIEASILDYFGPDAKVPFSTGIDFIPSLRRRCISTKMTLVWISRFCRCEIISKYRW